MPFALQPTSFIPVQVTADWTTANNAYTDVKTALEASFPMTFPYNMTIYITLVEGSTDENDMGRLQVTSTGVATWTAGFSTYPQKGQEVYIVDIY